MTFAQNELLLAFRQDHARLGRGFHDLSGQLRDGDVVGAIETARRLDHDGGAHIAFEEKDFYPLLAPYLGEEAVDRMHREHGRGFSVLMAVLELPPGLPIEIDRRRHLVRESEAMEAHIAECGELFGVMGRIPADMQNALYRRLVEWRQRRPSWTQVRKEGSC